MNQRGETGSDDARGRRVESETAASASKSMVEMGMSAAQVFKMLGLSRSMDAVEAFNGAADGARRAEKNEREDAPAVPGETFPTDTHDIGIALA